MILMLEDDPDRIRRFTRAIRAIAPSMPFLVWGDAYRMIDEIEPHLPTARLISLDHDLEPVVGGPADVGDGVMVAKALATHRQPCPVIIHSSNGTRAEWMAGEFELAGWDHRRVAPIGDRWIEEYWKSVARELLRPATAST